MISRRDLLAAVPALLVPTGARGQRPRRIVGAWSGAVTADGITIKVLATGPGIPVTLRLWTNTSDREDRTLLSDPNGVASFVVSGLRPRTRYQFAARAPDEAPLDGTFKTFADGPFSFRVVFASCVRTGSTSPVFSAMRQQQPDLFVHMGDLHYEDIWTNAVSRFRRAYLRVLSSPTQSALFRSVPLAYTWDDHDYGPNDSDRTSPS